MKRFFSVSLAAGLLASISVGATVSLGASTDTGCWDEYNNRGTRYYRTVAPKGLPLNDCTAGAGCFSGHDRSGKQNRLYVPYRAEPQSACKEIVPDTTTSTVVVTLPETTVVSTTLPIVVTPPPDTTVATTTLPIVVTPPPDTTVAPPTTTPPPVVTAPATTTTTTLPDVPSSGGSGYVGTFDGNSGLDRLSYGVYHRGIGQQTNGRPAELWGYSGAWGDGTGTWTGDHDTNCGDPSTQRLLSSTHADMNADEVVYACRDHVMTSMGDVDGYSIVWFSPDANRDRIADVFSGVDTVSWDVNVTDLGGRQWWEVSIVPIGAPFLATASWMADVAHIANYDDRSIVVGNGPTARKPTITTNGQQRYTEWLELCGGYAYNPAACGSKATRLPFSITDNHNGTVTVDYGGLFTQTVPGEFPAGGFNVYFKDHNYTPDKDGPVAGHTWHWDNIIVR